jgi:hypothetical protein
VQPPTPPDWSLRLIAELGAADRRAAALVDGLTLDQLNWQPRPGAWSIGQCLDHLRASNETLVPVLSLALTGRQPKRVDEIKLGAFSRWFIRSYIAPNPATHARAPRKIVPASRVELSVLDALVRSNDAARELIRRASAYDVNRIRYRNPFIPIIHFTVATGLEITAQHPRRHMLQAENVKRSPGFPARTSAEHGPAQLGTHFSGGE